MHELKSLGYDCDCNIGCSKYRIDVAVKNRQNSGYYYLGIECDLSDSSGTLRDRDRTREGVLKRLGWKMLRIWSKEWVEDSASVYEKPCE
jgi:very-short-patch-repair endonuclease